MTTVSSTGGNTTYTATAPSSSANASNPTASTGTYDGSAAVAKAQALAAQRLASGASGSQGTLVGLSPEILNLLQGGFGTGAINTLFGSSGGNAFLYAQTSVALYGAARKLGAVDPNNSGVSNLINKIISASNPPKTGTDTTA